MTVRTCWAHNQNLERCDMPAGHPGNHSISKTWTDEECVAPKETTPPTPVSNPGSITVPTPETLPPTEIVPVCIACQHRHKGGECKCGCYEYIG